MKILLAETDVSLATYALNGFAKAGHNVHIVDEGKQACIECYKSHYDLIILNHSLRTQDGVYIAGLITASSHKAPILFLTDLLSTYATERLSDECQYDYLAKPFVLPELLARANALVRRSSECRERVELHLGDLRIHLVDKTVERDGVAIELNCREFLLLEILMRNEGSVVSRSMLLEQVWDFHFDPKTTVVETHIRLLREKIDAPFNEPLIHAVDGMGYSLRLDRIEAATA